VDPVDPTFRTVLVGRVLLASAIGKLTVAGLTQVLREVAIARRSAGQPILYWPVFDPSADIPAPEVRGLMRDATETLFRHCESMTLIIPGEGLKVSLLRPFMRGLVRAGGHSAKVRIVDSLTAAVQAANEPGIVLTELLSKAHAAGIDLAPGRAVSTGKSEGGRTEV
jgi:hypothetical protein